MSGAAYAAFRRAVDRRHLAQAMAAAHDLPVVSLADALELVLLAAEKDVLMFERAAARWLGRYLSEVRGADIREAALALGALAMLGARDAAVGRAALLELARRRKLRDLEAALRRTRQVTCLDRLWTAE